MIKVAADSRADAWQAAAVGIARELASNAVWADGKCAFHGDGTNSGTPGCDPPDRG